MRPLDVAGLAEELPAVGRVEEDAVVGWRIAHLMDWGAWRDLWLTAPWSKILKWRQNIYIFWLIVLKQTSLPFIHFTSYNTSLRGKIHSIFFPIAIFYGKTNKSKFIFNEYRHRCGQYLQSGVLIGPNRGHLHTPDHCLDLHHCQLPRHSDWSPPLKRTPTDVYLLEQQLILWYKHELFSPRVNYLMKW